MAAVTLGIRGDMRGVFACRNHAIMTARTGPCHTRMIKTAGTPGDGVMAVLTGLCGGNVGGRFTRRIHPIVAGFTATGDATVVEANRGPGLVGDMTVVTGRCGLDMVCRLTGCGYPVMTAGTGAGDDGVVEGNLRPAGGRGMTTFTDGRCGHMGIVLAGGSHTIMTGVTTLGYPFMIEVADSPGVGVMAVVA